jgi:murein DD-endopeptidase MepM/ murein hydrolase activator NlpD
MTNFLRRNRNVVLAATALGAAALIIGVILWRREAVRHSRSEAFARWWIGSEEGRAAMVTARREPCPGAPFLLPAEGYIGLLYGDSRPPYSAWHRHQGIDIFSEGAPGVAPVYAAYDGYLTRESNWRSAVIIYHPEDPLSAGCAIWTYYAHMADEEGRSFIVEAFPPGTRGVFVQQGTLLGYTGNYSNEPLRPVAVHLHFSIVLDDGGGHYLNELVFANTLDPSPYLGMAVNVGCAPDIPDCTDHPECSEAITP